MWLFIFLAAAVGMGCLYFVKSVENRSEVKPYEFRTYQDSEVKPYEFRTYQDSKDSPTNVDPYTSKDVPT